MIGPVKDKLFCDSLSCELRSVSPPWIGPPPSSAYLPIRPLGSAVLSRLRGRQLVKSVFRGEESRYQNGKKKKFPFQWKTGHGWFFPGLMLSARTQIPSPVALSNTPIYNTTHPWLFLTGDPYHTGYWATCIRNMIKNVKQKFVMQKVPLEMI